LARLPPRRGTILQPRAPPWVTGPPPIARPERARESRPVRVLVPYQGVPVFGRAFPPGRCPGLENRAPSGRKTGPPPSSPQAGTEGRIRAFIVSPPWVSRKRIRAGVNGAVGRNWSRKSRYPGYDDAENRGNGGGTGGPGATMRAVLQRVSRAR